jgi:hypothetical protein
MEKSNYARWFNMFDHSCFEENKHEFIKRLYSFNFRANKTKIHWDFALDVRLVEIKEAESKWI